MDDDVKKAEAPCLWTGCETAKFLKSSEQKLRIDRMHGKGIPYIKFGRSVRYDPVDVKSHLEACKVRAPKPSAA